jgi:hypothetical protein
MLTISDWDLQELMLKMLKKMPAATADVCLLKAKKEIEEILPEPRHKRLMEYADALICIKAAAMKDGFYYDDLRAAEYTKGIINCAREWELQPDGTYQHITGHAIERGSL